MSSAREPSGLSIPVTHFASGDLWGGAEALLLSLASEQFRRNPEGVRCVLMNPGRLATELAAAGVPTLVLDESRQGFLSLVRHSAKFLQGSGPSIIHSHREKENLIGLLAGILSRRALGYVSTIHGLPEPVPGAGQLFPRVKHAINSMALRHGYDAIVGVSGDISKQLMPRFPRGRVYAIHNGVSNPGVDVRQDTDGRTSEPLRLLALGRLVPIKRFDRLRELSDRLAVSVVGRPTITLCGEGPLDSALRTSLGVDNGVQDIVMAGYVADTSVPLSNTDALVITSDHEGLPMAALEALASGVPVFSFAVGGLPELVGDGIPLKLAPAGDTAGLAQVISDFFANAPLGSRVAPPADWKFGIRFCADSYADLYKAVAQRG